MGDLWVTVAIGVLKSLSFVYDVLTFIPYYLIQKPGEKLELSNRIKAKPTRPNDPDAPYRALESYSELTRTPNNDCHTMGEMFTYAVHQFSERDCLGTRELLSEEDEVQPNGKIFKKAIYGKYNWLSYEEVNKQTTGLGSGLLSMGIKPRENICLFAETRAEWMMAALGCFKYNFPLVTLYATLGDEAIIHGVNESDVSVVITSNALIGKFKKIISRMPKVKLLVYMNHGKKPDVSGFPADVAIHSMVTIAEIGAQPQNMSTPVTEPKREDIAVIMYTSGSTGIPKGVLISHGNLLSGMSGQVPRVTGLSPEDTYIGYLPLAHVLELTAELSCITHGVRIGYSSPQTLSNQSSKIKKGSKGDSSELRPTLMAAVPVIMDRLYKNVWEKVNEGGKFQKALFTWAYDYKKKRFESGFDTPMLNKLVFKKVQDLIGGRVRLMLSGGAPLSADTQRFMNICFCCPVGQGYGLTETCGAGTIHDTTDMNTGRVGAPLGCCEIRLVNWEEGGYTTDDKPYPRGEVVIGGGNVAMGYYKNPKKTAEDFKESDGQRWFYSGDIGCFHPDGCLQIVDRKKDLVKLQGGEYVSLGKVETAMKMVPIVENCCVHADSKSHFAVCLVVPNHKQLIALAEQFEIPSREVKDLCRNVEIEKAVLKAVNQHVVNGASKLERFEIPQRITLVPEAWTPDSGLVTDAFKLKRRNIQQHYEKDISRMYA